MSVREGDILAGKYRVEKLLGMGGMGAVVAAHHLQLDQRVAIKFLLPDALKVAEAVGRFAREARAATKIRSEHVVRIIDVGNFDSGAPYMVMEYLEGRDLGAVVRESGPLTLQTAADYLLQACEALAEAHALGIIHRDLKPANLFLTQRMDGTPLVKVLDFGISKLTDSSGSGPELGLTKTTAMMGSPLYMSPEQMSSARNVDVRTDIWAMGVILYELLAGVPPFNADTLPQLCAMVLQAEPDPIRTHRPELGSAVDEVIARCLRKQSAERYANVAELAVALGEHAPKHARASVKRVCGVMRTAGVSAAATALPPSSADAPPQQTKEHTAAGTAVSWSESQPVVPKTALRPYVIGAGVVALLGVVGALFAFRSRVEGSLQNASSAEASTMSPASSLPPENVAPDTSASADKQGNASPPAPPSAAVRPTAAPPTPSPAKKTMKPLPAKTATSAKPVSPEKPGQTPKSEEKPPAPPVAPPTSTGLGGRT